MDLKSNTIKLIIIYWLEIPALDIILVTYKILFNFVFHITILQFAAFLEYLIIYNPKITKFLKI